MSRPIDLSAGTPATHVRLGPGNCIRHNQERSGISIAPNRVRTTCAPRLTILRICALHIYLYFQQWIFTRREPRPCPSSESSGWLKTLSSDVPHLAEIDKGAEIVAALIESFFYCYCVENRFVMSTVVPDIALVFLFFMSPISPSLSLSLALIFVLPHRDQGELSP